LNSFLLNSFLLHWHFLLNLFTVLVFLAELVLTVLITSLRKGLSSVKILLAVSRKGLRPPLADWLPADVSQLLQDMWEKTPQCRPSFAFVHDVLSGCSDVCAVDMGEKIPLQT
jgi:hypothetical protein